MIPKIIHYCWFGGNPLTPLAKRCIASWKKFCPDYQIIEWNESNYDVNCCEYSSQAYKEKKWAFVSDVARYKILYEYGGLYFDVDVEIVRSIDALLNELGFIGFETLTSSFKAISEKPSWIINPGLALGGEKGCVIFGKIFKEYAERSFYNADGSLNLENICSYSSKFFYKNGMKSENIHQNVLGIHLYPKDFFNPMDTESGKIVITENTYSIHHYAASWTSNSEQRNVRLFRLLNFLFGKRITKLIRNLYKNCKNKIDKGR